MNARWTAAHRPRAVLFDLDGTLLDTVADISLALNRALAAHDLPALGLEEIRTLIGRGAPTLIERTLARLGGCAAHADPAQLLECFSAHYRRIQEHPEMQARAFPGVLAGLAGLHALQLRLAVVTNKSTPDARTLLGRLGLGRWIDVVVGGDSGIALKPHPQPLLRACEQLRIAPAEALMVGDSLNDVLAARAAGMRVICVPYGYAEGADPRGLPCDGFVESLAELPALLAAELGGERPRTGAGRD